MDNDGHDSINIGESQYLVQKLRCPALPSTLTALSGTSDKSYIPITAIAWTQSSFNKRDLENVCRSFRTKDDVWSPEFATAILIVRTTQSPCEFTTSNTVSVYDPNHQIPSGPLAVEKNTGNLFLACKLVRDTQYAFTSAIVPESDSKANFRELPRKQLLDIAIPSRLYYRESTQKPLAGLRIGVKDAIALKGLRTGFGSKAWYDVHEPEKVTAPCIQRLLDAGAIVVGKLVSSEFCEGVEPSEWTQGICPLNPRGDGQQKPSSSSTGSAVAAAAYEWLDVTIGTDTGGSVRHPAGINGLFGQRPSSGTVDLEGVLGATDLFNTVGIFARNAMLFTKVGSFLTGMDSMGATQQLSRRRYNILYPVRESPGERKGPGRHVRWFPHPDDNPSEWTEAELRVEKLVTQLEAELHCERTYFNLYDFWSATAPKGQSKCLDEATGRIYGDLTTSSACENGIDDFVMRYKATHNGSHPDMGPVVKARLEHGRNLPDDRIAAALDATAAFKKWIETTFFALDDENTTTIMVFPQSHGTPDYRDDASRWDGKLFIESFSVYAFGYLCGCPDYTIPIGELPYQSRVTQQQEYLPVSFSLVGKPGADQELFNIVTRLYEAGIISNVAPGTRLYPTPD